MMMRMWHPSHPFQWLVPDGENVAEHAAGYAHFQDVHVAQDKYNLSNDFQLDFDFDFLSRPETCVVDHYHLLNNCGHPILLQ